MSNRIGPRACRICPPGQRRPCIYCGAKDQHRHVDVYDRRGVPLGSAAVCAAHAPDPAPDPPIRPQMPSPLGSSQAKRVRDQAYRAAVGLLRERHRQEFEELYAQVRAAAAGHQEAA